MVDTGATDTTLPRDVLDDLGAQPIGSRRVVLASGQEEEWPIGTDLLLRRPRWGSRVAGRGQMLGQLSAATSPRDMALPGLKLHQLGGDRKGTWAVAVSGNWRVTFTFVGKDADAVDYEDYH